MDIGHESTGRAPRYGGLRMSADEYLALPDDGFRYELVNGVVLVSPNASVTHQRAAGTIFVQIANYLQQHHGGEVLYETDVRLAPDLVYRPDIVYYTAARAAKLRKRLGGAPDLIVEVLSPESGPMDLRTKREDYERYGVGQYITIDSETGEVRSFVLQGAKFAESVVEGTRLRCDVIPGLVLDLGEARAMVAEGDKEDAANG